MLSRSKTQIGLFNYVTIYSTIQASALAGLVQPLQKLALAFGLSMESPLILNPPCPLILDIPIMWYVVP